MNRVSTLQVSCILLIIFLSFYLYGMAPSVTVGDSGEFIAAAKTLSLPHAPSYPLFVLLGKCAGSLVPWAHAAYKVNLLSTLCGAVCCVLFFLLGRAFLLDTFVSAILSMIFLCSGILREQSAVAEVFSLNTVFAVLILLCLQCPAEKLPLSRKIALAFFALGLGLGNHHTLILIAPVIVLSCFTLKLKEGSTVKEATFNFARQLPGCVALFILGFSIYLFLPIRSLRNPPIDWSNPETLQNFIRVITRADYGSLSLTLGEKLPRNFESIMGQVVRYLDALSDNIGWMGIFLGAIGWIVWFLKDASTASVYFFFFLLSGMGFLILGNLPFDSQSSGILPRFYLMSTVPFMLAIGILLDELRRRMSAVRFLYLFIPAAMLFGSRSNLDSYRGDFYAHDYGHNLLQTLEPNSVLFMDGGDDTFYSLAYFTLAQGLRPDVELHDRGGLIFKNPYGDDFRKISRPQKDERRQRVESAALALRPLYYSTFNREALRGALLMHRGLLVQAVPFKEEHSSPAAKDSYIKDYAARGKSLWQFYSYRGIYQRSVNYSYRLRALVPIYPFLEGLPTHDLGLFKRAAHFGNDILWLQSNLAWESLVRGFELTNANRLDDAEKFYRFVLNVDPKFASAYCNLGVLMERKSRFNDAESYYRKSIEVDPKYPEAYYNLGVLYWKQSRWNDVIRMFEKTLELSPEHPGARHYLQLAMRKKSG